MTVVVTNDANRDLAKGFKYYEKKEAGKGDYFLRRIQEDLFALRTEAGLHRQVLGFYKAQSARFPHALFYRVSGGKAIVYAIIDGRRRPAWILRQLRQRTPLT